ncbi:MAG: hypothetical protein QM657_14045 [Lacrimispora sp.]|uniref:hypothetical protein n=1 Tax=Lacrimispora sp. TaxID=2719234 RepID=UPI0039E5D0FC
MNKSPQTENENNTIHDKITVSTATLMNLLDCGRATATHIGTMAQAKIHIGKRILWSTKLIQQYLDNIAE